MVKETVTPNGLRLSQPVEFQSPLGEVVKETTRKTLFSLRIQLLFQSPLGEVVKETLVLGFLGFHFLFQSPLGEVVKETKERPSRTARQTVSIPSRGSGKGDNFLLGRQAAENLGVSIPSRGSGKGD